MMQCSRMDEKQIFTTSFDEMAKSLLLLVPKKDILEAREILFNFKKMYPNLFNANEETFEKEQENIQQQMAVEKQEKNSKDREYVFKKLLDSIVLEDHPGNINLQPQTFTELVGTIKNLQRSTKINSKRSIINILQIATLMQYSKVTHKRKYSQLLKEIGYSKSYGSFMLRFLKVVEKYPNLKNVTTTIGFIYQNIEIIENNIQHYFSPAQPNNTTNN